jgi:hypothetical protein
MQPHFRCLRSNFRAYALILLAVLPTGVALAQNPIHVTYLWHMHQPIYYPRLSVPDTDSSGLFNFSVRGVHDERSGPYTTWPRNAVQQGANRNMPNAGVQVSFSGSLMENLNGIWGSGWRDNWRWGRNGLRTSRDNPRLDLVGFAYHHSLMPLTSRQSMIMQIRLHREAYADNWDTGGGYSKGFFPPESSFAMHMIPALVDQGIEWVLIDSGHIDRTLEDLPWSPASSIRPNRADQRNGVIADWSSEWTQLQNVWAPTPVAAPFSYQPRRMRYVDPNSDPNNPTVYSMLAVPAARYEGNENARGGYGAFKPENVWGSRLDRNNNPSRPMLLVAHSDGDNFGMLNADVYHGQHELFLDMTRNNAGFAHSTVQDYLEMYPVPANDPYIHVEPGSWIGIDGGTPFFDKWIEYNAVGGEHPDHWNWSVLIAAMNRVLHAENLESNYSMNDVRWGIGPDTAKAWYHYLNAEASDYWYWDFDRANPWDANVTRASNFAIAEANKVIARHANVDRIGPSIFHPQRPIWNPGGKSYNEPENQPSDFDVWTFVDDVSGVASVTLHWRTADWESYKNLDDFASEIYAHTPGKNSPWNQVPMSSEWYPPVKGPLVPDPANRAMRYTGSVTGQSDVLVSYFVEATDNVGNISRSEIHHVWVGSSTDGGTPTDPAVTTEPAPPVAGQTVAVRYNPTGRPLGSAASVNIHYGYNGGNWTAVPGAPMTRDGEVWSYTYTVPAGATTITVVFNDGASWDNNGGNDWTFNVTTDQPPTEPPPVPMGLAVSGVTGSSITLTWNAASTATSYKIFRNEAPQPIGTSSITTFTDAGLSPETTNSYRIVAVNAAGDSDLTDAVSGTTSFAPVASDNLRVLDPADPLAVASDIGSFTYTGIAGALFTNGLTWTNPLTGGSGNVAYAGTGLSEGWFWSALVPLGTGANMVRFAGSYSIGGSQTLASDSPVNATYSDGWSNGSNGGSGFGAWTLTTSGDSAGHFRATTEATNLSTGLTSGFGLWASGGDEATARRSFNTPMSEGGKFTIRIDNNFVESGSSVGVALTDSGDTNRVMFFFVGGESNYRVTDGTVDRDTGISYTDSGLDLTFELLTSNTYRLTTGTNVVTGTLAVGGEIARLMAWNNSAGPDTPYNFYLGAMSLTSEVNDEGSAQVDAPIITRQGGSSGGFPGWSDGQPMTPELLREYAIGGAAGPGEAGQAMKLERDGQELVMTVLVRDDANLTVTGETTSNLSGAWTSAGVAMGLHEDQSELPAGNIRMEVRVPINGDNQFVRIRVSHSAP